MGFSLDENETTCDEMGPLHWSCETKSNTSSQPVKTMLFTAPPTPPNAVPQAELREFVQEEFLLKVLIVTQWILIPELSQVLSLLRRTAAPMSVDAHSSQLRNENPMAMKPWRKPKAIASISFRFDYSEILAPTVQHSS